MNINIKEIYSKAKAELLKVVFPSKEQIRVSFISVIVVVSVISLFLALIDSIMSFSISVLIK